MSSQSATLERSSPVEDQSVWFEIEDGDEFSDQLQLSRGVSIPWLFELVKKPDAYRINRVAGRRTEPSSLSDDSVIRFLGDEPSEDRARPRRPGFKPRS
jgi:hypothetical protein